jgi:predicted nucleic acid-binding protein
MGMLRLLTNARVMGDEVLTHAKAWQVYERMRQDERIGFASEPFELDEAWKSISRTQKSAPSSWTDSYLVAFARALDLQIVSFDRALASFDRNRVEVLI